MARIPVMESPVVAKIKAQAMLDASDPGRQFLQALGTGVGNLVPTALGKTIDYFGLGGKERSDSENALRASEGQYKEAMGEAALGAVDARNYQTDTGKQIEGMKIAETARAQAAQIDHDNAVRSGDLERAREIEAYLAKNYPGRATKVDIGAQGVNTAIGAAPPPPRVGGGGGPRSDVARTLGPVRVQLTGEGKMVIADDATYNRALEAATTPEARQEVFRNFPMAERALLRDGRVVTRIYTGDGGVAGELVQSGRVEPGEPTGALDSNKKPPSAAAQSPDDKERNRLIGGLIDDGLVGADEIGMFDDLPLADVRASAAQFRRDEKLSREKAKADEKAAKAAGKGASDPAADLIKQRRAEMNQAIKLRDKSTPKGGLLGAPASLTADDAKKWNAYIYDKTGTIQRPY